MLEPFQWISWACMHRYAGEQYIANEFKDLQLECEANGKYSHNRAGTRYKMQVEMCVQ